MSKFRNFSYCPIIKLALTQLRNHTCFEREEEEKMKKYWAVECRIRRDLQLEGSG